jgi:hypothetical protein
VRQDGRLEYGFWMALMCRNHPALNTNRTAKLARQKKRRRKKRWALQSRTLPSAIQRLNRPKLRQKHRKTAAVTSQWGTYGIISDSE